MLCTPFGPTGHTDNPRPQHRSSDPDKFLIKCVSQFTDCKRQGRNHSIENTTAGHSLRHGLGQAMVWMELLFNSQGFSAAGPPTGNQALKSVGLFVA